MRMLNIIVDRNNGSANEKCGSGDSMYYDDI